VLAIFCAINLAWIDRHPLLSYISGTTAHSIQWSAYLQYAAIPLAIGIFTVVSQAFPEVGQWLRNILQTASA
jgi:hypothetical protein